MSSHNLRHTLTPDAGEYIDETPPPIKNMVDKPPDVFIGRNTTVQQVINPSNLLTKDSYQNLLVVYYFINY